MSLRSPTISRVVVTGGSAGMCLMLASWLSEVDRTLCSISASPNGDLNLIVSNADAVVAVAQTEADLARVGSLHTIRREHHPSLLALLVEPSPALLDRVLRMKVDVVAAMPLPSRLLLSLLSMTVGGVDHDTQIAVLPAGFVGQLPLVDVGLCADTPVPSVLAEVLSHREREILQLLDHDLTNDLIAQTLVISPYTVKRHLENICRKLDVGSRYEAVRAAHRSGLLKSRRRDVADGAFVHDPGGTVVRQVNS